MRWRAEGQTGRGDLHRWRDPADIADIGRSGQQRSTFAERQNALKQHRFATLLHDAVRIVAAHEAPGQRGVAGQIVFREGCPNRLGEFPIGVIKGRRTDLDEIVVGDFPQYPVRDVVGTGLVEQDVDLRTGHQRRAARDVVDALVDFGDFGQAWCADQVEHFGLGLDDVG